MLRRLNGAQFRSVENGPFRVNLIQPGRLLDKETDFAFGPLARFDHANANVGTFVKMHDHINDEIFSYMWKGEMIHDDSTGEVVHISDKKLMMMNAGAGFRHEESVPEKDVEMLQIFIRPEEADLEPSVQFFDRPAIKNGKWNLIGGPAQAKAPLTIRQNVQIYDIHLQAGESADVVQIEGLTPVLYVMDGAISLDDIELEKRDLVTDLDQPLGTVTAQTNTTIVVFLVDLEAQATTTGLFSGIQR